MARIPVSVKIDGENLRWLQEKTAEGDSRSVSDVLNDVVSAARSAAVGARPHRSVVGTISCSDDDLEAAEAYVRGLFEESLDRSTKLLR